MKGGSNVIRRRRTVAAVILLLAVAGVSGFLLLPRAGTDAAAARGGVILNVPGGHNLSLTDVEARRIATGRSPLPVPSSRVEVRGGARITYRLDRRSARRALAERLASDSGRVDVGERAVSVMIKAPVVKQVYPNNCETAALQMLLATRGVEQAQRALQRKLRRDGPLDPRTASDGTKIWGDPSQGFVGRVEGGGAAGGFGVYGTPLIALADRWVEAVNLSGTQPAAIYRRLLSGHAVLAWTALADGPYETWRGPRGEPVTVNWGEHTVLLRGLIGGRLIVNDPLTGERLTWTKSEFEEKWALLGRRAISA
jgi:uncharacterized protein YvpB